MNYRPLRVGKLIREELGKIIVREMEFPDALVTITEVEVDKKMDRAIVRVSVIPSEKAEEMLGRLQKAQGYLHHLLFKKLNLYPMPHTHFELDRGPERAAEVERALLKEVPAPQSESESLSKHRD